MFQEVLQWMVVKSRNVNILRRFGFIYFSESLYRLTRLIALESFLNQDSMTFFVLASFLPNFSDNFPDKIKITFVWYKYT